nr:F-box domain-containing protein [Cedratvirus lena]
MQSLPDEVTLTIVSYLSLPTLCSLSGTCKRYRLLCCDKEIWFALFARKSLPKPEEKFSFASWLQVYQRSLMGKRGAKYVLTLYAKEHRPWLRLINRVPLHILQENMWKNILEPLKKNSTDPTRERYLDLTKRGRDFLCSIEDDDCEPLSCMVIDRKTVYDILYRLFYRGICRIDGHVYQQFQPD